MVTEVRDRRKNIKTSIKKSKEPIVFGSNTRFPCKFCGKEFSREKTVISHLCEQRRRFQQRETLFARYGYEAFLAIQNKFFGKDINKSEEEFRKSEYYLACVRLGHFMLDINCLDVSLYIQWLLTKNIPIDHWCKDEIYDCWVQEYIFIESPWEAFERSIKKMLIWADELQKSYEDYFRMAGNARILTDVRKGWISGWAVFTSQSGVFFLLNFLVK